MSGKKKLALMCSGLAGVWALIYYFITYFFAGGIPTASRLIGIIAMFLLIIISITGIVSAYLIRTEKSFIIIEILLIAGVFSGIIRAAIIGSFPIFWFLNINNLLLAVAAIMLFLDYREQQNK